MRQISTSFMGERNLPAFLAGIANLSPIAFWRFGALLLIGIIGTGCQRKDSKSVLSSANRSPGYQQTGDRKVIAQGQLLPAGGFIHLSTQPGDVAADIKVSVGERVDAGQCLVVMRSKQVLEAQKETLQRQRTAAERERENAIAMAERQANAAALRKRQAVAQQKSLERQSELLKLAESQVEASQLILSQLETISNDRLTSEFVGSLEIDRQRLATDEARLSFKQRQEAQLQVEENLAWATEAADAELESALAILKSANDAEALKIIDLQIAALDLQDAASEIVAPEPGIILAVNVTKGESSSPLPIIEMANTAQIVCEVEINEMDASLVQAGQVAIIRSRAFEKPLLGEVEKKYPLVGRPQLRSLDPLARVDYRAVTAIIRLDSASTKMAQDWLQLQVEVEIQVDVDAAASR
jgi:HlyD family secretion protein